MILVRFWGVRGSIPSPGPDTVRIGGNTSCVEVRCSEKIVILDGGTGLRRLGDALLKQSPVQASLFFSHVHWDHIQGFPFFAPAFIPGNKLDLYGGQNVNATLAETLAGQQNFPNFPVTLEKMGADIHFHEFADGQIVELGDDVTVQALSLSHPNGSYGYRVEHKGKAVCYCTDTEHGAEPDKNVIHLARNADLFIYDSQYTPEEYEGKDGGPARIGWGHSTFVQGVQLAKLAHAKRLVLFHHDPNQDDNAVLDKERRARELMPTTDAAYEGLVYQIS